jgi:hypothetical protein
MAEASNSVWDYDKYYASLKKEGIDYNQEFAKLDQVMGPNAQNIYREILDQQKAGSSEFWYQGRTASKEAAAADFALRLAENGIGSLSQLGQLTIPGDGENPEQQVTINKATGQPIPRPDLLGRGNSGLDIDYNLAFTADGQVIPYTSDRESSWMSFRENALKPAALLAAIALGGSALAGSLSGAGAAGAGAASAGTGLGTGISAGAGGLGLSTTGAAGLGINAGAGLTGTGILSGSSLGTGLLGAGAGAAGLAGLTGTGVLSGSTLGTGLLGTTGTGALTGTGILTGSTLGTGLLGTGAGTAATVGGVGGSLGANLGAGALNTGISAGAGAGAGIGAGASSGLSASQMANLARAGLSLAGGAGAASALNRGTNMPLQAPTQGMAEYSPEYYQQLQQYYNSYLPQTPRDVVSPLQQWYSQTYSGGNMQQPQQPLIPSTGTMQAAPVASQAAPVASALPPAPSTPAPSGMFTVGGGTGGYTPPTPEQQQWIDEVARRQREADAARAARTPAMDLADRIAMRAQNANNPTTFILSGSSGF